MDQDHYAWLEFFHSNFMAPINNPYTILDVGTGTGLWLLEMSAQFPSSKLIGIDLNYETPMSVIPQNCQFKKMDLTTGLEFADFSIDYIHHRNVYMIPMDCWPNYIIDCARILRPSGWLEIMETDLMLRRTGRREHDLTNYCDVRYRAME
ncbi:S-adenosyl-L-methionine-dependent methyltransferase [Syncephalis fuscata]|nr:S-adenosyl-L-methionine-dependent methyltransferase [Syncephalis fuscata]